MRMKNSSEENKSKQDWLKSGLHQRSTLVKAIKNRKLKSELRILKSKTKNKVHLKAQSFTQFSWRTSYRRRRNGIKLSWSLASKNVSRSKYRTFLLILGIILTVSLETGIVLSVDTLYDDFILDHRNQNYTDITVHPSIWSNLSTLRGILGDSVRWL